MARGNFVPCRFILKGSLKVKNLGATDGRPFCLNVLLIWQYKATAGLYNKKPLKLNGTHKSALQTSGFTLYLEFKAV